MMKKRFSLIAVFLLAAIISGYLLLRCNRNYPALKIITVTGVGQIFNYSRSDMNFGSIADSGDLTALAVSDGDLLYFLNNESSSYPFRLRYHETDGMHLSVGSDTAFPAENYLNGKLQALYFGNGNEWMKGYNREKIRDLRSIILEGDSIPDILTPLKEIAGVNPHIGLEFIDINDRELFNTTISIFKPEWLATSGMLLKSIGENRRVNLKDLEHLIVVDADSVYIELLNTLPNLKSLIIANLSRSEKGKIHFEEIRNLRSLSIFESDIESLSELILPQNLISLYLVNCPLTDIDQLRSLSRLKNLNLSGCDTLMGMSALFEIPSLQWLSLPPGISQENFDKITEHHKSLQSLELIGCKEIKDLSSLKQLKELKAITLDLPEIDFEVLKQLINVELIIIKKDFFDESESEITKLKKALPETHIVPGSGICMGSGWILLAIPTFLFIAVVRMLFRKYNG